MKKHTLLLLAAALFLLAACKHPIKPDALYGDWHYIKIDHPRSDDQADTTSNQELTESAPYISFSTNKQLMIHWGGKILSHGTFTITDNNINYTEQLDNGQTRTFPFYVSQLDNKTIVFETLDKNGSRVTAIKK